MKAKISTEFWVVLSLFMIALWVRFYRLDAASLSDDEIITSLRINHSFLTTIGLLRHSEYPPFYYAILNLWADIFGKSEWALRLPSALFSGLTVFVVYQIGKELFSKTVGVIAASLLAVSPFAVVFAQNAKMYPLLWLLAAMSFLYFFRYLKDPKTFSLVPNTVTLILSCYTMYIGFLFLVTQTVIFMLMAERGRWGKWFKGQLIVVLCVLPWLIWFLCSKHEVWSDLRSPGASFDYPAFFLSSFQWIIGSVGAFRPQFSVRSCAFVVNILLNVFLITFFLIETVIVSYKNKKWWDASSMHYYCLLVWIVVPAVIYFIFDRFFVPAQLGVRFIGFLQVSVILLISCRIDGFRMPVKRILVLSLIALSIINTAPAYTGEHQEAPEGWQVTAEQLTQRLENKDIVLSFLDIAMFKYYFKGDTSRFYRTSRPDITLDDLKQKGVFTSQVRSIYILYHEDMAPDIDIGGFYLKDSVFNNGMGFLHFKKDST